ncbi:hypothetical protein JCM14124_09640 [Humidesulfovibrio idahonensis]
MKKNSNPTASFCILVIIVESLSVEKLNIKSGKMINEYDGYIMLATIKNADDANI